MQRPDVSGPSVQATSRACLSRVEVGRKIRAKALKLLISWKENDAKGVTF